MPTSRVLLPRAVLADGLYLGRLKNLRDGQGCPKCETAQAVRLCPGGVGWVGVVAAQGVIR